MIERWIGNFYKINDSLHYISKKILNGNLRIDHIAHRSKNYNNVVRYYEQHQFAIQYEKYLFQNVDAEAIWMKSPRPKGCRDSYRIYLSQYIGPKQVLEIQSKKKYEDLYNYNPYLAWISLFNNEINHIALNVNNIEDIYENISKIKGLEELEISSPIIESKDGNIKQFSLKSMMVPYTFKNGDKGYIHGGFIEFYQRETGREGFDIGNSEKIYESTK